MKRLTTIITALALMLGMAQCRKNVNQVIPEGGGVYVTLTADAGERTEIGSTGIVEWTGSDKLYAVGAADGYLGALTATSVNGNTATFSGVITPTTQSQVVHFYYIGKTKTDADFNKTNCTYTYSIATQDGTLDGIENTMHLMHGSTASAVAAGATSFGTINMHNMMSIAKFDISGYTSTAKCSGALCQRTLNLKTGEWNDNGTTGDITLNSPSSAYHMALIPSATSQTFTFSKSDGTFSVSTSKVVNSGKFYTGDGSGGSIVVYDGTSSGTFGTSDYDTSGNW